MKAKDIILKAYQKRPKFQLTNKHIANYINELYLPDTKIFNTHKDYLKYRESLPRYSYPDERNGAGEIGRNIDEIIYVIPDPRKDEKDKIERFIKIEDKRKKLIDIKLLQQKLYSKETEREGLDSFNKIKEEIENLFENVLEVEQKENIKTKENPHPRYFEQTEYNKLESIIN